MAGSSHTATKRKIVMGAGSYPSYITVIEGAWVADSAAATVPNATVDINGYVVKAVINPGTTAPTTLYDITAGDPDDTTLDAFCGQLKDRSATATEQVYLMATNSANPPLLGGSYVIAISNNSVNSATGAYTLYITDQI